MNVERCSPVHTPLEGRTIELVEHHFASWPTVLPPARTRPTQRSCTVVEHGAARLLGCFGLHGYLPLLKCKPKGAIEIDELIDKHTDLKLRPTEPATFETSH